MPQNNTPYLIIGAGLAGLLLAEALLAQGTPAHHVALLDPGAPRASDSPGALMHAIPGRTLIPKPGTLLAFSQSVAWLERWRARHPQLIARSTMTRPDLGGPQGKRYMSTFERADYPETFAHSLLDSEQTRALLPALAPAQRAAHYGPAYCVELGGLLGILRQELALQGVQILDGCARTLQRERHWSVYAGEGDALLQARTVILCPGSHLTRWFPALPVAINGGELLLGRAPKDLLLHGFVSGGGHIAQRTDQRWSYGATYLRPPEDAENPHDLAHFLRPDACAIRDIHALLERLVPRIGELSELEVWRGLRAVFLTDRQPLMGWVPGQEDLFLLGALGSKGLLWGPGMATEAARLVRRTSLSGPLHEVTRAARAGKLERWSSPHIHSSSRKPA